MKNKKRIFWLIVVAFIVTAAIIGTNIVKRNTRVESVSITLYTKQEAFISKKEIQNIIEKKIGKIKGKQIKDIDVGDLESLLMQNPYILKANLHVGITGEMNITITQREPVIQVFNSSGECFWIDSAGYCMPPSALASPNVIVANGNIPCDIRKMQTYSIDTIAPDTKNKCDAILSKILFLASNIKKDSLLCHQIDQIYVNSPNNFHFTPKLGSGIVEIGDTKDLQAKLYKLKYLYLEGFCYDGWDNYKKINLEFKDQVVCTKK